MMKRYKPAAHYEVHKPGHPGPIGYVRRGILTLLTETDGYTGIIHTSAPAPGERRPFGDLPYITRRYGPPLGWLEGMEIVLADGERWPLRQIPREPEVPTCPDTYSALLLCCEVLSEQGQPRASRIAACLRAAPYDPCPECEGRVAEVEDCQCCGGYGFVPEV